MSRDDPSGATNLALKPVAKGYDKVGELVVQIDGGVVGEAEGWSDPGKMYTEPLFVHWSWSSSPAPAIMTIPETPTD